MRVELGCSVSFVADLCGYAGADEKAGDSADELGDVRRLLQTAGRQPHGGEERGYEEGTNDESESESRSSGDGGLESEGLSSDDESESESRSSECSAIHDIQDAVDSLYNLSPALNFFFETFSPPDTVETAGLERMIRLRFPDAEPYLLERLVKRIAESREKLVQPASFQAEVRTGSVVYCVSGRVLAKLLLQQHDRASPEESGSKVFVR